jgi:ferredoxin
MHIEWENRCALTATTCTDIAPHVFSIAADAQLTVSPNYESSQRDSGRQAMETCPTQAIKFVE